MKTFYLYDADFNITNAQLFEDGKQPCNAIIIENYNFVKGKYNPETGEVYETATEEEIAQASKPIVPPTVTNLQFRLALIDFGLMPSTITAQLNVIEDVVTREKYIALWEYANIMERDNTSLNDMAQTFGISQEQLDQLFINAETK